MKFVRQIFVIAMLAGWTSAAPAQPISKDTLRDSPKVMQVFREVVAKPSQYTVRVLCDNRDVALGTIVDADGWVITKASELRGKEVVCELKDGTECEAKIVGVSEPHDLAMLKIEAKNLPAVEWRDSKDATVGRWVASVGTGVNPVAIGVISVATRKFKLGDQGPKNSNADGGWLGVSLEESTLGAKISFVIPRSPAQRAGLVISDIILEAAGRKIIDNETLINTIQRLKPGDDIALKIKRGEDELVLKATLDRIPKGMLGNPQETMGSKLSSRRGGFPAILQHDTVLRPTDCGGPLVDLDSKTVGINIARAGRTETYAIPSEDVKALLADLKSGKLAPKADAGKLELLPKNSNLILRASSNLTAKDKVSKSRKGSYMKVHEITLSTGGAYIIEMDSAELDSYLIIEDANGKTLAEDDDGGEFPSARIVFRAPSTGNYRVIATSFNANETGNYTLTIRKKTDIPSIKSQN